MYVHKVINLRPLLFRELQNMSVLGDPTHLGWIDASDIGTGRERDAFEAWSELASQGGFVSGSLFSVVAAEIEPRE